MDRYWFFTWRTYGTWLPGSAGFVGNYVTKYGERKSDNVPGELTAETMPPLEKYCQNLLVQPPVYLNSQHAETLLEQLQETARYRNRTIDVLAIMPDHIHLIAGNYGDPDPEKLLNDWKAYASRALNRLSDWAPPTSRPRWWVIGGSKRILRTNPDRVRAIRYVRDQENPLLIWISDEARTLIQNQPKH